MNRLTGFSILFAGLISLALSSCTLNPFTTDNKLTGSPLATAAGAGIGAGTAWAAGAPKSMVAASGVIGGLIGYYVTTLRFQSGGIIKGAGQVFTVGDYVTIDIPTDRLFDTNSAEFLDDADPILKSAAVVLQRYPDNNIMVSGNTSGFGTTRWELALSEARARQVAGFLWSQGINGFGSQDISTMRKLTYSGYGNFFPIANNIRNDSIRQNSHIEITAYPTSTQLKTTKCYKVFNNIASLDEPVNCPVTASTNFGNAFSETIPDIPTETRSDLPDIFNENSFKNPVSSRPPSRSSYYSERASVRDNTKNNDDENVWGPYNSVANASHTCNAEIAPRFKD